MNEIRKDYILDRYVIIASDRGKRPHQFQTPKEEEKAGIDDFARGQEHNTPAEVDRIEDEKGNWIIRVFPNKFAAVKHEGQIELKTDNEFYTYANAYGYHEILVETPDMRQLWDLDNDELVAVESIIREEKALEDISPIDKKDDGGDTNPEFDNEIESAAQQIPTVEDKEGIENIEKKPSDDEFV